MHIKPITLLIFSAFVAFSCKEYVDKDVTNYRYFDVALADTIPDSKLKAVTNAEHLEYGVSVAYVNENNDTVIPFGKYAYYGTDTSEFYANVMEHPNDSTYGRQMAIDKNENVLFDLVMFDNGLEPFNDGLTRVIRNGEMGYANRFGQVVIACEYDYVKWFENGKAEVTYSAKEYFDLDEHRVVESDEWFSIDKKGNRVD